MSEAKACPQIKEPTAMLLSTVSGDQPMARVVLLKEVVDSQFIFYTNYHSKKGQELLEQSNASLTFYWDFLFLQVRIWGSCAKVSRAQSEAYWATRPRGSQISQWISNQSQPIESRQILLDAVFQAEQQFENQEVPCPEHWGGYALTPKGFEFWRGEEFRLHDRFQFTRTHQGATEWLAERLSP